MPQAIKKPSFNELYVLKFPQYITTWRLKGELMDGSFVFFTSSGGQTKMNLSRFNFLCNKYLIQKIKLEDLGLQSCKDKNCVTNEFITIKVETPKQIKSVRLYPRQKTTYTKEDLDAILDAVECDTDPF